MMAAMASLFCAAIASAQTIQTNVMYVCNGERLYIENCNIRDTSDTSNCMVGHPDTILPNGLMKYTYESRGSLKKLLPTCKQPSAQDVAKAQAFNKRIQDQQDAAIKRANESNPYAAGAAAPQPAEDPATHAMRRCVAAGRPSSVCLGNGLMDSLMPNVNGLLSSVAPGVVGKEVTGPQMAGVFLGDGQWRLEFSEASVAVSCADMRPDSHAYTIAMVNNRAVLTISSTPANIVLYASGDTLTGAGSVTVSGLVSAGVGQGYTYSGEQATIYEYRRVTRTCPRPNLSSKGAGPGVVDTEKNLLQGMLGDQSAPPTPAGLRMNGTYAASTGFSVGFYPESAILGCGPDAARAYPYTVIADGRQAVVKVEAPDHPLTMVLQSNNTLNPGSGPYLVEGRRIIGQNDNDDFTFAPLNATCNLAVLSPGDVPSGAVRSTASPATASAGSASAGGSTNTRLSTPGAPTGNAVLSVLNGFPAQAGTQNLLAGHPYVLLRESFEAAIGRSGVTVPAGTSAYKVFGNACGQRTSDCQKMVSVLNADAAAAIRADAGGKATFSGVPAGTYYLMISAVYDRQSLFWGQPVSLKAGANSVTLTPGNATVMK